MVKLPRGDPRRSLQLAVRTCRVLGGIALFGGTCAMVPLFVDRRGSGMAVAMPILSLLLYGSIGAAYLVFAYHMVRRRFWAVVAALALTSIGLLFMGLGSVVIAIMLLAGVFKSPGNGALFFGIMWGSVAFELLISAALGQLAYWLVRSFAALRLAPLGEARGFDVLPMAVPPTEPPVAEETEGYGNPT